jgi:hypothetical protein
MRIVFWLESLKGRDHSEDLDVDGMMLLEWILGIQGEEDVEWMHLARYRDQWQAVVNTVMNLSVA